MAWEELREIGMIPRVAGLWMFWCAMHSLLIAQPVLDWFRARLGRWFACYRLGYVVVSSVTLLPLFLYTQRLPQYLVFSWAGPWRVAQVALLGYALFMGVAGAREYDVRYFLGLRQIRAQRRGEVLPDFVFAASGILRYVRHPWYSGGLALVWAGGSVTTVSLVVKIVL
ncbi:MAG TPA: hypothetical protein VLL73_02720, partial [Desulfurivibrionaceae bacterium]|nr:hypothetical protein [Desulfurivibrionaceae bacterium]